MLKELCQNFIVRSTSLGLKGKKRDDALIDFMCGAFVVLNTLGKPEADQVSAMTSMLFATRGYAECVKIANK